MKSHVLAAIVFVALARTVSGQGYVYFSNRVPEVALDAPVFSGVSASLWDRDETVVQLYAGVWDESDQSGRNLVPVGDPVALGYQGDDAGYWDFNDDLVREVDFAQPGQLVAFVVRGWELRLGSTYEEASMVIGEDLLVGQSAGILTMVGPSDDPSFMVDNPPYPGLATFGLFPTLPLPEPSTIVLLGCGGLLAAAALEAFDPEKRALLKPSGEIESRVQASDLECVHGESDIPGSDRQRFIHEFLSRCIPATVI